MTVRGGGAALLAVAALAACSRDSAPLGVEDPWIRAAPPGAAVMAGYVRLRNHTDDPLRCDAASSPDFGAIEIHRTLHENGEARMLRNQVVELPPRGSAALEPGGYHLMMFRPQRALAAGATVPVTLTCGERSITAPFAVRPAP